MTEDLDGLGKVCREQTLLTSGLFHSHQPTFLLQENIRELKILKGFWVNLYLFLWIIIFDNLNNFPDLESKLIHVLGLIFISSFHLVEHTWRQIVRGSAYKFTMQSNIFAAQNISFNFVMR